MRYSKTIILCAALIAIAALLVIFKGTQIIPLLLILACPLAHLFMMKGMGHGKEHGPSCHGGKQESDEKIK